MTLTISASTFNRATGTVKREAGAGPVLITEHGEPAYVLLSYDLFQMLRGERKHDR